MIYAVITLAVLVLILYVCGCFLMRADSTDKDKLYPVLCWPWIMISAVGEVMISGKFEW